jgi:hypothetical protein
MISEKWPELLEAGLRIVFEQARDEIDRTSLIRQLFNVQTSNSAFEESSSVGGLRDWFEYKGAIEYAEPEPGWGARYEHTEYVQGMIIERKLLDDSKYREINARAAMLATSAMRTREKHAASVFNNAFSSSYKGGDDVALAGDHPYSPTNASTQSNKGSTALSNTSIATTMALMRGFKGQGGEHLNVMPDMLIVPPALESAAYVALNSALLPGGSTNDINYLQSQRFTVVVWKYLEDTNNWFMVDSSLMRRWLNWFDRVPIEFSQDPRSDFELMLRYRGYMRYSYGWDDWRWIYGHEVSGG